MEKLWKNVIGAFYGKSYDSSIVRVTRVQPVGYRLSGRVRLFGSKRLVV